MDDAPALPAMTADSDDAERAFDEALSGWCTLAFRIAYGVLRHRQDAEDVAQDAVLRARARLGGLRAADRLKPWLVRMTWRMAIDHRRSASRRASREQAVAAAPGHAASVEDVVAGRLAEERLFRALDELPEALRLTLVVATIEGHDTRETARLLGVAEGTVKSRVHAARKRLLERLR